MIRLAVTLLLIMAGPAWAESDSERYNNANELFRLGDHGGALELYERIDTPNVDVLFNRGVAAWRAGSLGKAMLAFERAQRMAPDDTEIIANIAFLNGQKSDQEGEEGTSVIDHLLTFLSLDHSIWLATFFYLLVAALLALRISSAKGRGVVRFLPLAASALLLTLLVVGFQIDAEKNRVEAIAMHTNVVARSAPERDAKEVFTFHEGTKVQINRTEGEWAKVTVRSGLTGWVALTVLAVI